MRVKSTDGSKANITMSSLLVVLMKKRNKERRECRQVCTQVAQGLAFGDKKANLSL